MYWSGVCVRVCETWTHHHLADSKTMACLSQFLNSLSSSILLKSYKKHTLQQKHRNPRTLENVLPGDPHMNSTSFPLKTGQKQKKQTQHNCMTHSASCLCSCFEYYKYN